MEAVKLESMHAPEHAMSSLVVAQVPVIQGRQGGRPGGFGFGDTRQE